MEKNVLSRSSYKITMTEIIILLCVITAVSALVHGSIGFGFPMLSTPLIALFTDVQTAIMLTVIPNIFRV